MAWKVATPFLAYDRLSFPSPLPTSPESSGHRSGTSYDARHEVRNEIGLVIYVYAEKKRHGFAILTLLSHLLLTSSLARFLGTAGA